MAKEVATMKDMSLSSKGGHLYIQTNEIENAIIHYRRGTNGVLTEVERVRTRGAGSGRFKPISGQESARMRSKAPEVLSSRRTFASCSQQMAATIQSPPSRLTTTAG